MKKIKMVDLQEQYLRMKAEVDAAMAEVVSSGAFIKGKEVGLFQEELAAYLDVSNCIACGNGTDALQVALMALDLEPGDEVITTPFTFVASAEVIRLLRLRPVFADVLPDSFNIDPEKLEAAITERTRAIIPVHLFGQCADMDRIMDIARKYGLYVIEDNAQALGAIHSSGNGTSKRAGSIGHLGTSSFFPSKNLGAFGDGGAIFTSDDSFGRKIASLVNHGMKERYYYDDIGVNSRLDTLQAAILRVKLKQLEDFHHRRQQAAAFYDKALAPLEHLEIPARSDFSNHIFHQYTLKVDPARRDELKAFLASKDIPAMIYYPVPLHLQKAYGDLGYTAGDLPVSEKLCKQVLSLPMHTEFEQDQLQYITQQVLSFFKS